MQLYFVHQVRLALWAIHAGTLESLHCLRRVPTEQGTDGANPDLHLLLKMTPGSSDPRLFTN